MRLIKVKMLNNKEVNNRLSCLIFPDFKSHICHFSNDIVNIKDYLIPYLVQNCLLSEVLESLSTDKIDAENFNILFCQHSLFKIIGERNE